jgi:cell division protein FtsW (lipid II flippase)
VSSVGTRSTFTARGLHAQARLLQLGRMRWSSPAWVVLAAAVALSILGDKAIATTEPGIAARQAMFLPIAIVAALVVALPDYRNARRFVPVMAVLSLGLLVFVLLPFVPSWIVRPYNGARRWINFVVMDFQPSELAKVVWVLAMALWLRGGGAMLRTWRGFLFTFVVTAVPMGLILVEPDLGTALLFIPTLLAMLLVAGARMLHIASFVGVGLILVWAVAFGPVKSYLKPHQQARIDALIYQLQGDDRFQDDIGFQGDRAMTIVGSGGVDGLGAARTKTLIRFNALPEEHNDMIFAVIACRWGAYGAAAVWGLYLLFAAGGLAVAALSRDAFGRLLAVGVVVMLFLQMLINTGMTIGVLPITGMTLPFVSSGGSSLVMTWVMVGLILNVGLRRPRRMERWETASGDR